MLTQARVADPAPATVGSSTMLLRGDDVTPVSACEARLDGDPARGDNDLALHRGDLLTVGLAE